MQVRTVTTTDRSLLHAVRGTLSAAEEAFLCVAFVQERGLHLVEKELDDRQRRRARTRLLVTTTFQATSPTALARARHLGLEVRILNPGSGRTFHPKLYLGAAGVRASAVIGSANLTGGLATNVELAVALDGRRAEPALAQAWDWAEALWRDDRADGFVPQAGEPVEEPFDPSLYQHLKAEVRRDPVFLTLGPRPRPNRVVELSPVEVHVETERSRGRGGAEPIPAWMFNLAWERLRTLKSLTNVELLQDLRVHRSSAVCAILARLPPVEPVPGKDIRLRWR